MLYPGSPCWYVVFSDSILTHCIIPWLHVEIYYLPTPCWHVTPPESMFYKLSPCWHNFCIPLVHVDMKYTLTPCWHVVYTDSMMTCCIPESMLTRSLSWVKSSDWIHVGVFNPLRLFWYVVSTDSLLTFYFYWVLVDRLYLLSPYW